MSQEDRRRYRDAAHAVQTGVAAEIGAGRTKSSNPKHLRVGVNMAMVEHTALAKILIAKGIITGDEYDRALAEEAEAEQHRYEARLGVSLA